ncbi:serine/arginine repetitive matrix protein 1-like [Cotesia glomerata]|uniref:serine/arginine repetitive matrix protein 1-like n=1 Tax=Cotesia glomerata TaxID=32391 RepID=UPI001D00B925|nr:serine/arginine repetitive matrix protein 1-like [Cotesia glomerata]
MKWHIIAAVLLTAAFIPKEILAKPSKARYRSKGISKSSKLKNNPANRRPTSTSVTSYNPRTSIFRPIPSAGPSLPPPPPPSPSSHFGRLRLSSGSQPTRSRTPSPQSSSPSKSTASGGSRNTYRYQNPYVPTATNPLLAVQPGIAHLPITSGTASGVSLVTRRRHVKARTSLQQLGTISRNSRSQTRSINPPPLVRSPSQNPPPLPSYQFPSLYPVRPPRTRTTKPPAKVANSVPGPSESRPTSITALVQAGAAPAPGSRAAQKAAKTSNMKPGISKSETKEQATPQQINANIGTCKDKNASADKCFDILILALSWGPATKALRYAIESPINRAEWSIHGFWPSSKNNGRVPFSCDLKKKFYDHEQILPIKDLLKENWLSLNGFSRSNREFWEHEWIKHGTCASRLPAMKNVRLYFEKTLEIFYKANVYAKLTAGGFRPRTVMTQKDMRDKISMILKQRVNIAIQYHPRTSEMWLSEIRLCYDLHFNAVDCPPNRASQMADKENLMIIYSL